MIYFLLYTSIILILYSRTYKYYKLIDDPVPREQYLWFIPEKKTPAEFYNTKRSPMYTITNIGVYIATCLAIHLTFGWQTALLYAVMPTNVSGVAWATGNYYMTAVLFVTTAYYFATHYTLGIVLAPVFYFCGLHSTVSAIPFVAFMLIAHFSPLQVVYFLPLLGFLFGKRFRHGLKIRMEGHKRIGVNAGVLRPRHIFVMVKVVAYYTMLNLFPSRLGFFHHFGKDEADKSILPTPSRLFWVSLALMLAFTLWSYPISPIGFWWWILFIGIFSQFTTFGQFITERYMYLANVGFCLLIATFLAPYPIIYAVLVTLWFYRSHIYIPAWKHNINLFSYSISAFPYTPENYNNVAAYYIENKQWSKAIEPLLLVIKYGEGGKDKNYANLANCFVNTKRFDKALYCMKEVMRVSKDEKLRKATQDAIFTAQDKQRKLSRIQKDLESL